MAIETSEAGDSILGVFSRIEDARRALPQVDGSRLDDYRIEIHAVDEPYDAYTPWQVSIDRDGQLLGVEPIVACAYCDEDHTVTQASFVDYGGSPMRLAVWARTKGMALIEARQVFRQLHESGAWPDSFQPLTPVHTEQGATPAS